MASLPDSVEQNVAAAADGVQLSLAKISEALKTPWTLEAVPYGDLYAALPEGKEGKETLGDSVAAYIAGLAANIAQFAADELFRESLNVQASSHVLKFEIGATDSSQFPESAFSEVKVVAEKLVITASADAFPAQSGDCGSKLQYYL